MVGPAIGPTLGGYLTDNFGWRSIFNVNVPLGILAATMAWLNVEDAPHTKKAGATPNKGIDWVGLSLLCLGVGCFQYILERGETDGWWDSKVITTCAILAFTGISSFIYWELRVKNPIMNLRLFKSNILRSGTMLMLALGVMLYALTFAIPIFVANIMPSMSATQTGKLFMPGAIATGLLMFPVGTLLQKKVNPKLLVLIGLSLGELSVLYMTRLTGLLPDPMIFYFL